MRFIDGISGKYGLAERFKAWGLRTASRKTPLRALSRRYPKDHWISADSGRTETGVMRSRRQRNRPISGEWCGLLLGRGDSVTGQSAKRGQRKTPRASAECSWAELPAARKPAELPLKRLSYFNKGAGSGRNFDSVHFSVGDFLPDPRGVPGKNQLMRDQLARDVPVYKDSVANKFQ
jgi:hypothetical protein